MTDPIHDSNRNADRIAKVMARAGVASRREAERMIVEGRVSVNGKKIDSPALDVLPTDRITVDGKKLDEPQETRMWLYYKPLGLITSENDEKGRQTVFDALPRDLPRVMTVGRLDLNSEGLLLLTNDGELKRRLELPSTGWLRRYRVRVNGTPSDMTFDPLRRGVTIEGEDFAPMEIKLDSQQGANAWLTVGIREGKNREIRRAMAHVGLQVNRLIRVGYGPFKLTGMDKNEVVEVKRKVLRDQLGGLLTGEAEDNKPRAMRPRGAAGSRDDDRRPEGKDMPRRHGGERGFAPRSAASSGSGPERPRFGAEPGDRPRPAGDKPRWKKSGGPDARRDGDDGRPPRFQGKPGETRKPFGGPRREGQEGPAKPFGKPRADGARKPFAGRDDAAGGRKPYGSRDEAGGGRKPYAARDEAAGGRKPYGSRDEAGGGRKPYAARDEAAGGRKPYGSRDEAAGGRKPFGKPRAEGEGRSFGAGHAEGAGKPFGKPRGDGPGKPFGKPRGDGPAKPRAEGQGKPRPAGAGKPFGGRPQGKPAPRGDRPQGDRPQGSRPQGDRPRNGGPRPGGKPRG